jgi:transposase
MQLLIDAPSILVCTECVDFRKSIDGLLGVILSDLNVAPRENIFIFFNRARNKVKLLAWHKNGFVFLLKRLEKGAFFNITDDAPVAGVTRQQLSWLLAGLDWVRMTQWGELEYRDFQ